MSSDTLAASKLEIVSKEIASTLNDRLVGSLSMMSSDMLAACQKPNFTFKDTSYPVHTFKWTLATPISFHFIFIYSR
jgi:hypothetical protein